MTVSVSASAALADELQALHDQYQSWRKVQRLHYPKVPAGTLNRIANSGGEYLPKKHWRNLGLTERRKRSRIEKQIAGMARETRKALVRK